jgi:hypothetical protein
MSIEHQMPRIMECKFCGVGLVYTDVDFSILDKAEVIGVFVRSHGPEVCKPWPNRVGTQDNDRLVAQLVFASLEESH